MTEGLLRRGPESDGGAATLLNLTGDYSYMSAGYYASLDAELRGERVLPTTAEALDAYVVPIALAKARRAGLPVPESALVTDRFPAPPFLAYPVNPFTSKGELIQDAAALEARRKGLTYTGKYAVHVQQLPQDSRVDVLRCVLDRSLQREYEAFAREVYATFGLPLARVRVVVSADAYLLSALEPLPYAELTRNEKALLERALEGTS